jgi:Galactose oxidase, central domain
MSPRNVTLTLFLTTSVVVACGTTPASKASSPTPCSVVAASPAVSSASAEAAGAPGLWALDGSTWTWLANEPPPGPRVLNIGMSVSGGIAYDPGASRLMHVNETGTHLWNGQKWIDVSSDAGPSPSRLEAELVYDNARHEVVLFGGRDFESNGTYLNDTWVWDVSTWRLAARGLTYDELQQTPSASPDFGFEAANIVWDNAHHVVLLLSAFRDPASGKRFSATWEWNGSDWRQVFPSASPPTRFGGVMAFDGAHSNAVLFGGFDVSPNRDFNDTWTWDGRAWAERFPAHIPTSSLTDNGLPGPFSSGVGASAMAYDPSRKVVVLVTTDAGRIKTWTWDGSDWTQQQTSVSPRASAHVSMTYDTHSHRMLLVAFADPVPYFGPCSAGGLP